MANATQALIRSKSETVFNVAQANGDSVIFALFSKPINAHNVTGQFTFPASVTAGQIDMYFGVLGPQPVQSQANQDSTKMTAPIVWEPSAGHTTTSGTPITATPSSAAQFVKFTISSIAVPAPATISNVQSTGTTFVITATAHGFAVGDTVTVAAVSNTTGNGTFVITAKTTNTFTYAAVAAVANASDTGTATDLSAGISGTVFAS
jgi:hypothetical protein